MKKFVISYLLDIVSDNPDDYTRISIQEAETPIGALKKVVIGALNVKESAYVDQVNQVSEDLSMKDAFAKFMEFGYCFSQIREWGVPDEQDKVEKPYLAYDGINSEYEEFATIEEAEKFLEESFLDQDEGYHPDLESCKIYKLEKQVKLHVIDRADDYTTEQWLAKYSAEYDEIWTHEFISI